MNFENMTMEELEARRSQIATELDADDADLDALEEEARNINAEIERRRNLERRREEVRRRVAEGAGATVRGERREAGEERQQYDAASPEYRRAWLRNIAIDERGHHFLGEMTREERAAFTFMTTNTAAVVPTDILNRIVELVRSESPMLEDATHTAFTRGFGVPRHKGIVQGDAEIVTEGGINDDEQDEFDLLSLDGKEIKKHITMTKKMQLQSISAFEDWLVVHLADRIRVAKEKRVIAQLDDATYGIAAENKISGTLSDDEVLKIFSKIDAKGAKKVYANAQMIWNVIAKLKDAKGDKLFIPNSMSDPMVAGKLYGADVKEDPNLADGVIYAGVAKYILANDFEDIQIVPQIETKSLNRIFTGYSLFDAGLENPKAMVKYTHTDAVDEEAEGVSEEGAA